MVWLLFSALTLSHCEMIDRIAVSVGTRVITETEVLREIRITAFLNGDPLDVSPTSKRKAADRLVEQRLVRRELEAANFPEPDSQEVDKMLQELRKARAATPEQFRQDLNKYGIAEKDLRDHLQWQRTLLRFLDVRFRPGVSVSEEEIKAYFEKQVRPKAQRGSADSEVSLEDYREKIEQAITSKRVDEELDDWLKTARQQTRIEYRPEVFK